MQLKQLETSAKYGVKGASANALFNAGIKKFRSGFTSLKDDLKVLRPRTTVHVLEEKLSVSTGTVSSYLRQIEKSEKLDKWVAHELKCNQKNRRFEVFRLFFGGTKTTLF